MDLRAAERLQSVNDFDSLLPYLRDELDWPVEDYGFDDLTFQYTARELGLDDKSTAKVTAIRRLRPLDDEQPWGIFFLELEPKRLPVVALRRVLSKITLKKRASSNRADSPAWHADDILFISRTGESDERHLTFAHFAANPQKADLPVLKVLGWDASDTVLRVDHVAEVLKEKLVWPEDPSDSDQWRKQWRDAFTLKHREQVTTAKEMASRLAELARGIRGAIGKVLEVESENGPLTKIMDAFRKSLIHDLDPEKFADTYAQTITYGLLSARITDPSKNTLDDLASHMQTNPFLKELMESFIYVGGRKRDQEGVGLDFDELGVSDVIELLDNANMEAVVRDFGKQNQQEDPVIHFFEGFLQEYDKSIRKYRGVFYTPRPVVSFIVRSVDELLRTEFGLEDGLADTTTWGEVAGRIDDLEIPDGATADQAFVQILDPATGTGTFLVEVIDLIHKTMTAKWQAEGHGRKKIETLWNGYVPEHLLPRLHGYELMMAPYAIAHMKIGLKLYETGYRFESEERARVYLTNALEPAQDFSGTLAFAIPALANEAEAVNAIKREHRFTVVIGNPPYSAVSSNLTEAARILVEPYRFFGGEKIVEKGALQFEKNINDDYVKFLRFAESLIGASAGLVGYITNNGYLEAPTLRGMRQHLTNTFQSISLVDLHGDSDRRERAPDGSADENVFDIKRGVAISLLRRLPSKNDKPTVIRADIFGERAHKYIWLHSNVVNSSMGPPVQPSGSQFLFVAQDEEIVSEYFSGIPVDDLFIVSSSGFESGRDELLLDFTEAELTKKVEFFASASPEEVTSSFSVEKAWGKSLFDRRSSMTLTGDSPAQVTPVLMYPYDWRYCFYRKDLLKTNSWSAGQHLREGQNAALMCMRQVVLDEKYTHVCVSPSIVNNRAFASQKGKVAYFPLLLDPETNDGLFATQRGAANLSEAAVKKLMHSREFSKIDPWRVFYLVVAQFFSGNYRDRYQDFIIRDFPRAFRPKSVDLEEALVFLGEELVVIQTWESPTLNHPITTPIGCGDFQVEKVTYADETVWIDREKTSGFSGVPEEVWKFRIGGYQVCEKWLKDRGPKRGNPGRVLTDADIEHYQKIVVALSETIRIMAEIDEVIEAHGGWPGAFQTGDAGDEPVSDVVYAKADDGDTTQLDMVAEPKDG